MEAIDAVRINFNPEQLTLLNICLAFLMFGVALDIKVSDFRYILRHPRMALIGLSSQLLLLPILTVLLARFFDPPASIALGMVLIASCPGGNVSNFMVHLSKANAALSVMLTSITTISAVILTPVAFSFWSSFIPGTDVLRERIFVDPLDMVVTIIQLIFIPLIAGMYINHRFEKIAEKIRTPIKIFSILIFFSFVIFAMIGNYQNIIDHVGKVFWIVLVHNSLGFLIGYAWSKAFSIRSHDARAISIETGIQNSGLGLILIFNFFDGIGGMAMITAWWGIWHLISGFCLAMWWSRRPQNVEHPISEY
jgi:BASS family bile acid:Na+ symporter